MTCKCGKQLKERKVATKTATIGSDLIVVESRDALCCDEHGVIAWGTFPRAATPWPPYRPNPYPLTPGLGPQPVIGPQMPTTIPQVPAWRPQITC